MTDTRLVVVANGPQGPPGTNGLAALAPWLDTMTYRPGLAVIWQQNIYVSLVRTIGEQPDTHPSVWMLVDVETHEGAQAKATAARTDAETYTDTSVETERTERTAADTGLSHYVDTSVGTEAAERIAADAGLQAELHTVESTGVQLIDHVPMFLSLAALDLDTLMPIPAPRVAPPSETTAVVINPLTIGLALEVIARLPLVTADELGQPGGVATLDSTGVLTRSQIPPIALVEFLGTVNSQAAMLALVGQPGDWCVRTDLDPSIAFMLKDVDPTVLANWEPMSFAGVNTVAGRGGDVVLVEADIAGLVADLAAKASTAYVNTGDSATLATATRRALAFAMTMGA